ncbi:hypothetical protein [Halocola ammonii]
MSFLSSSLSWSIAFFNSREIRMFQVIDEFVEGRTLIDGTSISSAEFIERIETAEREVDSGKVYSTDELLGIYR